MGASSKYQPGLWVGLCAGLVVLSGACGGSATSPSAPPATAHDKANPAPPEEAAAEDDSASEEEAAPPRSACDDGSCSPCGNGLCPTGWYCDESAGGGPACSWLPQCAQKSSCACLTNTLGSACKCTEQAGGLHVTCK